MGLFRTDNTVALEVGRLVARVDALEREVAALRAVPAPPAPSAEAMPGKVVALIDGLSRGDTALSRHLEDEARRMLAFGIEEGQVLETLYAGAIQ